MNFWTGGEKREEKGVDLKNLGRKKQEEYKNELSEVLESK